MHRLDSDSWWLTFQQSALPASILRIVIEGFAVLARKVVVIKPVLNAKLVDVDSIVLPTYIKTGMYSLSFLVEKLSAFK